MYRCAWIINRIPVRGLRRCWGFFFFGLFFRLGQHFCLWRKKIRFFFGSGRRCSCTRHHLLILLDDYYVSGTWPRGDSGGSGTLHSRKNYMMGLAALGFFYLRDLYGAIAPSQNPGYVATCGTGDSENDALWRTFICCEYVWFPDFLDILRIGRWR